ncbi:hypothetical protein DF185_19795 [Marinifilum breve]|uniref:Uncharacterized protein n=1 Tax=Marinifilum breve TaxID=2184082 RepID=A0A2V3ZSR6_9BACT|nr:hypothetical protein [Marinifilum breve]PXX96885.1 hypothetical protein DF185_19795 [Marinifilum breve]
MIQLQHARPNHDYFTICLPASDTPYGERVNWDKKEDFEAPVYEMTNPKNPEEIIRAELVDVWTRFDLNGPEGETMNAFAIASYGLPMKKLRHQLIEKYDILKTNSEVEFLLLKQV